MTASDAIYSLMNAAWQLIVNVRCTLTSVFSSNLSYSHVYTVGGSLIQGSIDYTMTPECGGAVPTISVQPSSCNNFITFTGFNYEIYTNSGIYTGPNTCTVKATFPGDPTYVIPDIVINVEIFCSITSFSIYDV